MYIEYILIFLLGLGSIRIIYYFIFEETNLIGILLGIIHSIFSLFWYLCVKTDRKQNGEIKRVHRKFLGISQIMGIIISIIIIFLNFDSFDIISFSTTLLCFLGIGTLLFFLNLNLSNLFKYYVSCIGISLLIILSGFVLKIDGFGINFLILSSFFGFIVPNLFCLFLLKYLS